MKAISKNRIGFRNPDGSIFVLIPNELTELPDYAEKDPMYKLAISGGVLAIVQPEEPKTEEPKPEEPKAEEPKKTKKK